MSNFLYSQLYIIHIHSHRDPDTFTLKSLSNISTRSLFQCHALHKRERQYVRRCVHRSGPNQDPKLGGAVCVLCVSVRMNNEVLPYAVYFAPTPLTDPPTGIVSASRALWNLCNRAGSDMFAAIFRG